MQLDADWNENVINFLNMLWKQSRDFLGTSACIGDSFRIGKDIPIDHMLQARLWKPVDISDNDLPPDRGGYIFLNANDRPRTNMHSTNEKGSLFVGNAKGIRREFNNLDLSRFRSIYVRFKFIGRSFKIAICPKCSYPYTKREQQYCTHCGAQLKKERERERDYSNRNKSGRKSEEEIPALKLKLYSWREENGKSQGKYEYEGEFIEPPDAGGFFKVRFNLLKPDETTKELDEYDISHVSKLSIYWDDIDDVAAVCVGLISAEPMALVVSAGADTSKSNSWTNIANATASPTTITSAPMQQNSVLNTYYGNPTILERKRC